MKDETSTDSGLQLRIALRRFGDAVDCLFKGKPEALGGARAAPQIPEERRPRFGLRPLFDAELPARHALLSREDAMLGFVPRRERRPPGVDVGKAPPHLIAPRTLDLGFGLAHAVEELEREDGALLGRECLRILE